MKFYEKYPQLRDKAFLTNMLVNNVYSTMALENQEVPKAKVEEIVAKMLKEKELKGEHFHHN
jgi:hypothetical protein